jgi:hypothetical protein
MGRNKRASNQTSVPVILINLRTLPLLAFCNTITRHMLGRAWGNSSGRWATGGGSRTFIRAPQRSAHGLFTATFDVHIRLFIIYLSICLSIFLSFKSGLLPAQVSTAHSIESAPSSIYPMSISFLLPQTQKNALGTITRHANHPRQTHALHSTTR